MPQTCDFVERWNEVYETYACEVCDDKRRIKLIGAGELDLAALTQNGCYTCCVNLRIDSMNGDGFDLRVHACDLLPVIIGSRLDACLRRNDSSSLSRERAGCVYMLNSFWCFSNFLITNSQLCHRYRSKHSSTVASNVDESSVRLYVYDRNGKGNMLFTRDDSLCLRDKCKREIIVCRGNETNHSSFYENSAESRAVADEFIREILHPAPYEIVDEREFFRAVLDYMSNGVARDRHDDDSTVEDPSSPPDACRDIDHLDNKRIASAPALYACLLRSLARDIRTTVENAVVRIVDTSSRLFEDRILIECLSNIMMQYASTSRRANLLQFISRKTTIRRDWSETMKRQLKTEIRKRANAGTYRGGSAGSIGCGSTSYLGVKRFKNCTIRGEVAPRDVRVGETPRRWTIRCWLTCTADVSRDSGDVPQQFYCSKIHRDVEYDHEILKRMRVINQNAIVYRCRKVFNVFSAISTSVVSATPDA